MRQKEKESMDRPHRLHPVGTTRSPQGCLRHPGWLFKGDTRWHAIGLCWIMNDEDIEGWFVRIWSSTMIGSMLSRKRKMIGLWVTEMDRGFS
ncbi:hypothetical protein RJT34_06240 [Clitoria ternatea]|uniref:Uncharacterized protein n=1 Tax=Clitoria ternatea TaxID=43366 RepID=A0AAN9PTG8_CLITE